MGILGSIIQPLVLPMLHPLEEFLLGRTVALELVRDNDSGGTLLGLKQLAEKLVGGRLVASALHQNIDDLAIFINSSPQVILLAVDFDDDFVEVPLIGGFGATVTNLIGIGLGKLPTPLADCFGANGDAAIEHHLLDILEAEGERVV